MSCTELTRLREEVAAVRKQLSDSRNAAQRMHGTVAERRATPRSSDLVSYLERRLNKAAAQVERHIAQHGCS